MTLEVLRWRPVTPLGTLSSCEVIARLFDLRYTALPHYVEVEDEYKGYRIPAGSVVLGNAWAILNDPVGFSVHVLLNLSAPSGILS